MELTRDTEEMLEQWGLWVVQGSGVHCCAAPSQQRTPMITDDEALLIDRLMGRLGKRYPECGEVLLRYYTTSSSFAQVGKRMGFGEEKTRQLWKAGVAWLDGALESQKEAA
jgi:hypothetical protein